MPDGSYNNLSYPDMGKAHEPYARSVQQMHPLPRNMLPDAGLVFDTLLRREKVDAVLVLAFSPFVDILFQFVRHPAGLSSMMFSFAALVIHT